MIFISCVFKTGAHHMYSYKKKQLILHRPLNSWCEGGGGAKQHLGHLAVTVKNNILG